VDAGDSKGLLLLFCGDSNGFVPFFPSGESNGLLEPKRWENPGDGVDPNGLVRCRPFEDGVINIRLSSLGLGLRLAGVFVVLYDESDGESKGLVFRGRRLVPRLCLLVGDRTDRGALRWSTNQGDSGRDSDRRVVVLLSLSSRLPAADRVPMV